MGCLQPPLDASLNVASDFADMPTCLNTRTFLADVSPNLHADTVALFLGFGDGFILLAADMPASCKLNALFVELCACIDFRSERANMPAGLNAGAVTAPIDSGTCAGGEPADVSPSMNARSIRSPLRIGIFICRRPRGGRGRPLPCGGRAKAVAVPVSARMNASSVLSAPMNACLQPGLMFANVSSRMHTGAIPAEIHPGSGTCAVAAQITSGLNTDAASSPVSSVIRQIAGNQPRIMNGIIRHQINRLLPGAIGTINAIDVIWILIVILHCHSCNLPVSG